MQSVKGKMDSLKCQEIQGENVVPFVRMLKLGPSNRTMSPSLPQIPPKLGLSPGRF